LLVGDPGLGKWNAGNVFNLAAQTQANSLTAAGETAIIQRVSSIRDFNRALTQNGYIDGSVIYFGHGGYLQYSDGRLVQGLWIGQKPGVSSNITADNVDQLSGS